MGMWAAEIWAPSDSRDVRPSLAIAVIVTAQFVRQSVRGLNRRKLLSELQVFVAQRGPLAKSFRQQEILPRVKKSLAS